MNDVISEYQKWKQQGDDLRAKAKQAMESRFHGLLSEAIELAEEYRADFGVSLKPPSAVTSFRYKASKGKAKKAGKAKAAAKSDRVEARSPAGPRKPNRKVIGLQKRLATAQHKLEESKATGKPTRLFEDKIYEI